MKVPPPFHAGRSDIIARIGVLLGLFLHLSSCNKKSPRLISHGDVMINDESDLMTQLKTPVCLHIILSDRALHLHQHTYRDGEVNSKAIY